MISNHVEIKNSCSRITWKSQSSRNFTFLFKSSIGAPAPLNIRMKTNSTTNKEKLIQFKFNKTTGAPARSRAI